MIAEPPAWCRWQSHVRVAVSLMPAIATVTLAARGQWAASAAVFLTTFVVISIGTILPRVPLFGPLITSLPKSQVLLNEVWLTIDDGPDPATTPQMLDLLDQHGAKAAFFVIGAKAAQHPGLVQQMVQRGHTVGNHSQTHPSASFWRLRPGRLWREIAGCQETLRSILGVAPVWFRPPVGHHNLFLSPLLRASDLKMVIWNCRGFDAVEKDVSRILGRLRKSLRPGSIILLHDGRQNSCAVLEGTLQLLKQKGLKPATLQPGSN